jgi:predicted phosphodiesterase
MKSFRGKLIFAILIAAALSVSNPDINKHREKIAEKFKEQNPVSGILGAGDLVKKVISYDNYYLFSKGKISVTNESVSFGIASFVFVYGNLDLIKYKDMVPKNIIENVD